VSPGRSQCLPPADVHERCNHAAPILTNPMGGGPLLIIQKRTCGNEIECRFILLGFTLFVTLSILNKARSGALLTASLLGFATGVCLSCGIWFDQELGA
jgi:hypothetical protein